MDEKELNKLMEEAVEQILEWAKAEPNVIDRDMLNTFALPIGIAHLKSGILPEELANIVILCLVAAYNLGAHKNKEQKQEQFPNIHKLIKWDD